MNWLLSCPECEGVVSRVTQVCPSCGVAIGRGRLRAEAGQQFDIAPQSIFLTFIDALRTRTSQRFQSGAKPDLTIVPDD